VRSDPEYNLYAANPLLSPVLSPIEEGNDSIMDVRSEIVAQFKRVAQEQDKQLAPLTDGLELLNSGLDSLSFAILVTRLEDTLGVDPFTASEDAQFPVTFGDFVGLYENVAK
jgi:acyl carrier protein